MSWLPLEGIKVVDFSALIPGPFTSAILAALHERSRSGRGTELDLSLYEAGLFCAALRHGIAEHTDARAHIWPVNDLFETADGSVLILGSADAAR